MEGMRLCVSFAAATTHDMSCEILSRWNSSNSSKRLKVEKIGYHVMWCDMWTTDDMQQPKKEKKIKKKSREKKEKKYLEDKILVVTSTSINILYQVRSTCTQYRSGK